MTSVVPTSEEDPALSVLRFTSELAWADAGPEVAELQVARICKEAQEIMVVGRWLDLVSLMLTFVDLIFSKVSEKDLEWIFTVICNLVTLSESLDEALEMVKLISANITQQANDKPVLRLKILFNLYNLLENPRSRCYVYMKALNLAVNGKVTEHIIPSFKNIDSFLKEWDLGILDQRKLFLTISNILEVSKSSAKDFCKFLTKYLATFSGEDEYTLSEAKEEAVRTIIEFVKAPDMYQCDLIDIPAVRQLEKDVQYALVYQLLKIFLTHSLDAYLDFHAANSTLLKSYGLVHEECITKMRLMSLVDLGSGQSNQIPYALIKDTLRINDDEVEVWVAKAISAKLIDCKMDQMNQVVTVRIQELQDEEPWEERTLHLLHGSKIDQEFSQAQSRKRGVKNHKIRWMRRPTTIPEIILELQDNGSRESALRSLSNYLLEKREEDPENYYRTGYLLYNSCSTMSILVQEVVTFLRTMGDRCLSVRTSKRLANVLTLFQCIAANKESRQKFVSSFVPNYLVPIILFDTPLEVFENVRAVALSVVGILCQAREPKIIQWAIESNMVEVCQFSVENGNELSKVSNMPPGVNEIDEDISTHGVSLDC